MPPNKNNPRRGLWFNVAVVVACLGIAAWFWYRASKQTMPQSAPVAARIAETNSLQTTSSQTASLSVVSTPRLTGTSELLKAAPDVKATRQQLEEMRRALASMPPNAAVAEIRQFLDSRADAPTRLGFKLVTGGTLDETPTLRTFLLDELARIDPAAAADYAKIILSSKDSPDEWAVALRNLAQGEANADGRALLEQKMGELLQHEPWQQEPSVGFLEAFDVAVFLGGTNLMPVLSDLIRRKDNPAVAHASFLTLDRLVINDPAATLAALQASPDLIQDREQTRGNYFARVDVRDPRQRQILEDYLFDPRIGAVELEAFAGTFPNANFMISPNLLTQTQTPDRAALVSRDAESLRVVQQWLADPRFASRRPALEKISRRLEEFVRQAKRSQ